MACCLDIRAALCYIFQKMRFTWAVKIFSFIPSDQLVTHFLLLGMPEVAGGLVVSQSGPLASHRGLYLRFAMVFDVTLPSASMQNPRRS
jgi:hypothetical protein